MRTFGITLVFITLISCLLSQAALAQHGHTGDHHMVTPGDVAWSPGPASLPEGARFMVLWGDPTAEGTFAMRIWLPPHYTIRPHSHPADENITVISGTFHMGLGEAFDRDEGRALPTGSFATMAAGTRHFAWTGPQETVIQLHGIGPWQITYVDPADDPRLQD
jgi:quercetin dioxygenase-like cupin family protein